MDFSYSEEQAAIREMAAGFAADELAPHAVDWDRDKHFPVDTLRKAAALGMGGIYVGEDVGGSGLSRLEAALIFEALSTGCPSVAAYLSIHNMSAWMIDRFGSEAQRAAFLPDLCAMTTMASYCLTEPGAGSDAAALRTKAVRDGDAYVLDGMKCYITNAPIADLFTVFARTDPETSGARGVSAFIVERGTPGLSTSDGYRMMGQSGSPVGEVHFEGCRVPAENLIGGVEGLGFKTAMKVLNKQRIHLAALCTGPAIRMFDLAMEHARTRQQSGHPIIDFQLVAALLADCQTEIHAARALILETARARDEGRDIALEASICKYFASEMCGRVADRAVQVFGGAGYVADHSPIERYYRDVRLFRIYEGTSQIHQMNIVKQTLRRAGA